MSDEQLAVGHLSGSTSVFEGLETITPETLTRLKKELVGLMEDKKEAEKYNDSIRAASVQEKIEKIEEYISGAYGFSGKVRKVKGASERARKNISKLIRTCLDKIG